LRDLISFSQEDVERAAVERKGEKGGAADGDGDPGFKGFAAGKVAEKLNEALDMDLAETLAEGWAKVKIVREAAARSIKAPGTTEVVTLGQHEQTSTHRPILTLVVAEQAVSDLVFTLELVVRFKSVKLAISGGKLQSVAPGEASAIARLKYKSVQLKEQSTPAWVLPGVVRLPGDGLHVPL